MRMRHPACWAHMGMTDDIPGMCSGAKGEGTTAGEGREEVASASNWSAQPMGGFDWRV